MQSRCRPPACTLGAGAGLRPAPQVQVQKVHRCVVTSKSVLIEDKEISVIQTMSQISTASVFHEWFMSNPQQVSRDPPQVFRTAKIVFHVHSTTNEHSTTSVPQHHKQVFHKCLWQLRNCSWHLRRWTCSCKGCSRRGCGVGGCGVGPKLEAAAAACIFAYTVGRN